MSAVVVAPTRRLPLVAILIVATSGIVGPTPYALAAGATAESAAAQLVNGQAEQSIASYTEALADTGLANDRRAVLLNDRAVAYTRVGRLRQALDDYNAAVQLFAEYPAAYNNRGNLLLALGHANEALKDFDRALLLAPEYGAAYSNRANAKVTLGKSADAIADFTKSVELLPGSAAPLSGRGLAFLASGRPHAAIRDFSRAVKASTSFASAYRNRAEARMNIQQGEEAVEDLSRAIAFDPNNGEIYVLRGYGYLTTANPDAAIKDFTRAIELNKSLATAFQGRGLAYGLANAFDQAYADLNSAIELDPRSAVAFAFRGFVYKQAGRLDIGQKDIETALKLDAENPEAIWVRGEISEASGKADAAVRDYRQALVIKPGWRFATDGLRRLGAGDELTDETEVDGLGLEDWRVVIRAGAFTAVSKSTRDLRVPLEMLGVGRPKLLAWDIQAPPHQNYAVLRYASGKVGGSNGPEDTELAALVDIEANKVLAIQPHRQGARVATWRWEEERLEVASIDGVTDEFELKTVRGSGAALAAGAAAGAAGSSGRSSTSSRSAETKPGWAPWDQPMGTPRGLNTREAKTERRRKTAKPKTLFDLLFN